MGVNALRGGNLGVARHLRDGHHIRTLGDQNRGGCVPEGVGIDVGRQLAFQRLVL